MAHLRALVLFGLLLLSAQTHAISTVNIQIAKVETLTAEAKNITLSIDVKTAQPTLKLKGIIKPSKYAEAIDATISCGVFQTANIGEIKCLNGLLSAERIKVPFEISTFTTSQGVNANLTIKNGEFSDASGLHAGEKLSATLDISVKQVLINKIPNWQWTAAIDWPSGELFWQPFYFGNAGHTFKANGLYNNEYFKVSQADLVLKELGTVSLTSQLRLKDNFIENLSLRANDANFAALYPLILKPLAEKTAFNNLEVSGQADLSFHMLNGKTQDFEFNLRDANVLDNNGKFAFNHINAHIPWDYDDIKNATFGYTSGQVLKLPLGKTNMNLELNRYAITSPKLTIPILDGAFNFTDLSAAYVNNKALWHVSMDLSPFSMQDFSTALGWPTMAGKVSANVPLVTYANGNLNLEGDMLFRVFDGVANVSNLSIQDPLGIVPKLYADIKLRNLDLGELTRTYSFGAIEGKLDGDIEKLQMQNWKPVYFNGGVKSSAGDYPRKISQRAVENITALGGEGTAAALQRTFLRFFKDFNYEKIGFSCLLRNDICVMSGVESTQTGYIIVKGSGLPAVNVNGYTNRVSLADLLSRIKRITDTNTKVQVR